MGDREAGDNDRHSADFLLAEYGGHREAFWKSEEIGEKRVNFFISIVTAVLAASVIREKGVLTLRGQVDPIFYCGLGALLLFGIVTLARLIRRNLVSTDQLRALGRIRAYFVKKDWEILPHLFWEPRDDIPLRKKKWKEIVSFGTGGLVETVALVNSLVVGALCVLLVLFLSSGIVALFGLGGFIGAWVVQFLYVKRRYEKGRPKPNEIKFARN